VASHAEDLLTAGPATERSGSPLEEGLPDLLAPAVACTAWAQSVDDERIVLMGLIVESAARLTRQLGAELEAAVGLPLTWFIVLVHIARSADGRLTMSQLGSEISLTSGGMTRLIDRMTDGGLVERQSCPSDRRRLHVTLTPDGEAMLARAMSQHLEGLDRHLLAPLDEADRAALVVALAKLRAAAPACNA
jgi:DNA-binding MarR family transcriptional regulator